MLAAGRDVHLQQPVAGDVAAAGADVAIDGNVAGYVMSAGRHVTLTGSVGNDLWAAGETVDVRSAIANNAMIAGRTVTLSPDATVDGSARLAGDTVRSEGRVRHDLRVAATTVSIGGDVGGSVNARGDRVSVLPNAVIRGDFVAESPRPPEIAPGAQILGAVRHEPVQTRGGWMSWPGLWIGSFLALFLLGAAALLIAPTWPREVSGVLRFRPGASLLAGILTAVLVPVAAIIVALTVVGIPLAIVAVALYVAMLALAAVLVSLRVGDWTLARMRRDAASRWLPLTIGVLMLTLLMSLPVVGALVSVLVVIWGAGAIVLERRSSAAAFRPPAPA